MRDLFFNILYTPYDLQEALKIGQFSNKKMNNLVHNLW